jgi:hypothetical protein
MGKDDNGVRVYCAKTKRDGTACRNRPLRGSTFCFSHAVTRFNGNSFWWNAAMIGIYLSLLFGVGQMLQSYILSKSGASAAQVGAIGSRVSTGMQAMVSKQDAMEEILSRMASYEVTHERELKERYPFGYAVFTVQERKTVIPSKTKLESRFMIDWSAARIEPVERAAVWIGPIPEGTDAIDGSGARVTMPQSGIEHAEGRGYYVSFPNVVLKGSSESGRGGATFFISRELEQEGWGLKMSALDWPGDGILATMETVQTGTNQLMLVLGFHPAPNDNSGP